MHIISGRFKGFPISPALKGTRPTTDRTKEAMFSHLEAVGTIAGARVLDLYAGTGALGFEALSRGATYLEAVESAGQAAGLLSKSAASLVKHPAWNPLMQIHVHRAKVERFVHQTEDGYQTVEPRVSSVPYDLVFIDPPYNLSTQTCQQVMSDLVSGQLVGPSSLIILERSKRSQEPIPPAGWVVAETKSYGETQVYYLASNQA